MSNNAFVVAPSGEVTDPTNQSNLSTKPQTTATTERNSVIGKEGKK